MNRHPWFRRFLAISPVLVMILWVAGIARIHDFGLEPIEWAALVALAFALHVISRRLRRPRPLPQLPPGTNPAALAAVVATISGVIALIGGGALEWLLEEDMPSTVALPLRALWHGACGFAGAYCAVLPRVQDALERPEQPGGRQGGGGAP